MSLALGTNGAHDGGDPGLDRVVTWFHGQHEMEERFAKAIRQSFDEVFDGQRTGRYHLEELGKVEKTYIGTKVEIVVQAEFGLQRGHRQDYLIVEEEVDAKWSMRSGGWMIPTEAHGELCLCLTADDARSTFSVGLVRAGLERLRVAQNKDKKRSFNPEGIAAMSWLAHDGALPENLLLNLDQATREAILDFDLSGQRRVTELFRRVQNRIVRREVLLTVARQDDGPKRARDSRKRLRDEGILILGHQERHPQIAKTFGLAVPRKGEWISCSVVPAAAPGPATVELAGSFWRLAEGGEEPAGGPENY